MAVLAVAGGAIVAGVMVGKRVQTGDWELPTGDDFVRVKRALSFTAGPPPPSRTIYLHRGPLTLVHGPDDAPRGVSSVVQPPGTPVELRGYRGSTSNWKKIVACVRGAFAPFDVVVTDQRPPHDDFVLVAVGGKPQAVGYKGHHASGLAPFNGEAIPRAVVFAFSDVLRNQRRPICETIAMEVAHAYGLDHAHDCKDFMTYLPRCGTRRFVDKDVPCGEHAPRACEGGGPTQNSYRHLLELLGPARPPAAAGAATAAPR